ncbi:MAG: hypothetical protein ABIP89_17575, partial [Polyangiaceae bacterium]
MMSATSIFKLVVCVSLLASKAGARLMSTRSAENWADARAVDASLCEARERASPGAETAIHAETRTS